MKKLLKIMICVAAVGFYGNSYAQQRDTSTLKEDTKELKEDIKDVADTVANKTAEIASKGYAEVTDQVYKDKVGPAGQTIYIDEHSKYYYIDKEGKKVFVTSAQLKDKPNDR
ncbi:hypothetical protein [Albibacterium bauzanense]|uniref:PepSY domain-containing protein n=1 Tax=Albibacterium bauzanense TaxID=653929 RepID=A0A4R1LYR9_9SPHI|nr:hypothetical protein [Albibacterium bauzanense]TCK84716.1 hypothetical protein C8N28_0008 [Albibacterium bauzanense]